MNEMIERVARAIAAAEGDDPDGKTGSLLNEEEVWWQHRIPQARAAIEAMRGPTYAMTRVKHLLGTNQKGAEIYLEPGDLDEIWQAMIDAALSRSS